MNRSPLAVWWRHRRATRMLSADIRIVAVAVAGLVLYSWALLASAELRHSDYGYTDATSVRVAAEMWIPGPGLTVSIDRWIRSMNAEALVELRERLGGSVGALADGSSPVSPLQVGDPSLALWSKLSPLFCPGFTARR